MSRCDPEAVVTAREEPPRLKSLKARLKEVGSEEIRLIGGEVFMGLPLSWFEQDPYLWRCTGGHVGDDSQISNEHGYCCQRQGCRRPVARTFPGDRSGPLRESARRYLRTLKEGR
jgi:hypothetical protein